MHKLVHTIRFESARKLTKLPKEHRCSNLYGLAFKLEIHVEGKINPDTGFVIDFNELEESAFGPIKEQIDHNYLNNIEGLENPTSEVLVEWIWDRLIGRWHLNWNGPARNPSSKLVKLVLWENETSRIEYSGN